MRLPEIGKAPRRMLCKRWTRSLRRLSAISAPHTRATCSVSMTWCVLLERFLNTQNHARARARAHAHARTHARTHTGFRVGRCTGARRSLTHGRTHTRPPNYLCVHTQIQATYDALGTVKEKLHDDSLGRNTLRSAHSSLQTQVCCVHVFASCVSPWCVYVCVRSCVSPWCVYV